MSSAPVMQGCFVAEAARLATQENGFIHFDMKYGYTTRDIIEQVNLRNINCAVVNRHLIPDDHTDLLITIVVSDKVVIAMSKDVSDEELAEVLKLRRKATGTLSRFIEVGVTPDLRNRTDHWYRQNIPSAGPMYTSAAFHAALEICNTGVATMHCPLSVLASYPESERANLKFFHLPLSNRDLALIMPRHLLTLSAYRRFYDNICKFFVEDFAQRIRAIPVTNLP